MNSIELLGIGNITVFVKGNLGKGDNKKDLCKYPTTKAITFFVKDLSNFSLEL